MRGDTKVGWLYSLANDDPTNWGDTSSFHDYLGPNENDRSNGYFVIESKVWGKLLRKDCDPTPGDGFAFYHSTRASFAPNDLHKKKPRVSLVGELQRIEREGQQVSWIEVVVDVAVFDALRDNPIVRDDSTRAIFQQCGIVPGPVASLYPAPHDPWKQIVDLVQERMAINS